MPLIGLGNSDDMSVTKLCTQCDQEKPLSDFYMRSGYDNYHDPGHRLSECKACMKARAKRQHRLPPTETSVKGERLALAYLRKHGVYTVPGKAMSFADVDLVAFGCVGVEVKHAVSKPIPNHDIHFLFKTTPRQQKRGFLSHVVLLICEYPDGHQTYHVFPTNFPAFYRDGQIKQGFTWYPGRDRQRKHDDYYIALTDGMMEAARDNIGLIYACMETIQDRLMQ